MQRNLLTCTASVISLVLATRTRSEDLPAAPGLQAAHTHIRTSCSVSERTAKNTLIVMLKKMGINRHVCGREEES